MTTLVQQKVIDFFQSYPKTQYDSRTILLRPHEPAHYVYYLVEGSVDEYDISSSGSEVVVNTFNPSAFFPISLAINPAENHYFFEVARPITVHIAPINDVVQFLHDNHDVTFDLLQRVYRGTDGVLRRMAHLMGGKAQSRLVFELLNAARRTGAIDEHGHIALALTESDFAKRTGLSRETISRAMKELKESELVYVHSKGITITHVSKLERLIGSSL